MREIILVFTGGGIGSLMRFFTGKYFGSIIPSFPVATLVSNISGALILGIIFSALQGRNGSSSYYLFVATGVCGGYSTFSTFTLETFEMMTAGNFSSAALNVCLNFVMSMGGLLLGMIIGKMVG